MTKQFRDLEKLVAKIQQQLAPNSEVIHNTKLMGHQSGVQRQIDVLVRDRIGQYEILIVIECKDYKRPIDVKGVEEFVGLFEDVKAHKGVLVCPSGFTLAAKTLAQNSQIDLYSPVDTDLHKWTVKPTIPAICDFRSAVMQFDLSFSAPFPFSAEIDYYRVQSVFDNEGNSLGTPLNGALRKWNSGRFPIDVGTHECLPIFDHLRVRMSNGHGMQVPVNLGVTLHVQQKLYFGQFPILKMSGFKDEVSDHVIANAFQVGLLDPIEVQQNWRALDTVTQAPVEPILVLTGLMGWAQE